VKQSVAIIGGGASALVLACELDPEKFQVVIYEKNAALGRKFLVAGDGGLNFTHSENEASFISKFTPSNFLKAAFKKFPNTSFIKWMNDLDIPTFVGSSGRLFPQKGIKPIEVLDKIKIKLLSIGVHIFYKHTWKGFTASNKLLMKSQDSEIEIDADICVFCLGGASWSVTGSDGSWLPYFQSKNIQTNSFQASNCAFQIMWEQDFVSKIEGKVLKNISSSCGNQKHLGEVVLTQFGLEGSGVYPLSPSIRSELDQHGTAILHLDFKPNVSLDNLIKKLNMSSEQKNVTSRLKENINLSPVQILLLKNQLNKSDFLDIKKLASFIKDFQMTITALAPIDEAISSVGGISLEAITEHFELKDIKNKYVIGEMLDYDAPTGGYLLQSCFSMASFLANHLNTSQTKS